MNITDKNALWTKYFLIENNHSIRSLKKFITQEVNCLEMSDKTSTNKKIKLLRYMLKCLTRKEILKNYAGDVKLIPNRFTHFNSMSKNKIIDKLKGISWPT